MNKTVTIAGAGLAGTLLAIFLARRGYKVNVYERRPDARKTNIYAGKSINLALSDRGLRALEVAGIDEEMRKVMIPMPGRFLHNIDGSTAFLPYGKDGQAINSVSRGGLNIALLNTAQKFPNIRLFFNHRCLDVDLETAKATFLNEENGQMRTVEADHIVGADGAFSAVRARLQKTDRFNYSQSYIPHGYKELVIPANEDGSWKMEKNALHIWPRGQYMMIALPNLDGTFTCTLFFPFESTPECPDSFATLKSDEAISEFFHRQFADAVPIMPTLLQDFAENPASSLVTVRCFPWSWKDKVTMLGDAAHAIVPFFGQGMNCAFEDCQVFDELLARHEDDWSIILPEFERLRKPNADAIADLALGNFIEMRDLVADPKFQLRKKIEPKIAERFPDRYIPIYTQVTFRTDISYAEALQESKRQDAFFAKVLELPTVEERWNTSEFLEEISPIFEEFYPQ